MQSFIVGKSGAKILIFRRSLNEMFWANVVILAVRETNCCQYDFDYIST